MKTKIIVYGIGDNFSVNHNWIYDTYEVVGLADGSKRKQGKKIGEFEIIAPEDIKNQSYEKILITPNIYPEITKMLMGYGIRRDEILSMVEELKPDYVGKELNVRFFIDGGLGDCLIAINYITYFYQRYKKDYLKIDISCGRGASFLREIVGKGFWKDLEEGEKTVLPAADLEIGLKRYPEILSANLHKISRMTPELIDYILLCQKFQIFHPRYFQPDFMADGSAAMLEMLKGRKRIQQPDIYGALGITEEYMYSIPVENGELKKRGLVENGYITVHRGCEEKNYCETSVKLWQSENYTKLIKKIKTAFPAMPIVLLGAGHESGGNITGCDYDLTGKTDAKKLKELLKYSALHIDTEGGLVHLRHALHGGCSIVLFGATSNVFYGYPENHNIRTGSCPYPCEWVTADWMKQCIRENEKKICMSDITPEMVMRKVEETLCRKKTA